MGHLALTGLRNRSRLFGRLAGVLMFGSAVVALATLPLPGPRPASSGGVIALSLVAMLVGCAAWVAPWHHWDDRASLVLVPIALGLISAAIAFIGPADPRSYPIFFVVLFVWMGLAHRPWTSTIVSPFALVAYVAPLLVANVPAAEAFTSGIFAILVSVLVGESLAWGSRHLRSTEEALERERRDADRLRALAELRTTFMNMVSHELRTPVTICRGHIDVLGPDPSPGDVREAIEVVSDELARMTRIIEDITTVMRTGDPGFIRRETLPVAAFVQEVATKAKPLLNGRLRMTAEGVHDEATVLADPQRLTQALLNLLQNAAVHTPQGAPVELRVSRVDRRWRFEVEDHGGGLPPELASSVFEPFVQGPRSSGGMGLGLAIVRTVASAHGGSAGVRNVPGVGATFWVAIPAGDGPEPARRRTGPFAVPLAAQIP